MVFDSADIQTMIMMFIKDKSEEEYTFDYRKIKDVNNISRDKTYYIETILDNSNSDYILYLEPLINRKKLESTTLSFSEFDSILDKIDNGASYLEKSEMTQGIVFPQDKLNKQNANKLGNDYNKGDGVFMISNEELNFLNLTKKKKN